MALFDTLSMHLLQDESVGYVAVTARDGSNRPTTIKYYRGPGAVGVVYTVTCTWTAGGEIDTWSRANG